MHMDSPSKGNSVRNASELVSVKMKGLPYRVQAAEIEQFFEGLNFVRGSLRIGEFADGKRTGEAVVLFETEEDAALAVETKNHEHIGTRWVNLCQQPYDHYQNFTRGDSLEVGKVVTLNKIINQSNVHRCVKLRGIPFRATESDVRNFFGDFNVGKNDIVLEVKGGKRTGWGLVFLGGPEDCQRAH